MRTPGKKIEHLPFLKTDPSSGFVTWLAVCHLIPLPVTVPIWEIHIGCLLGGREHLPGIMGHLGGGEDSLGKRVPVHHMEDLEWGDMLRVEKTCPSLRKLEFSPESSGPSRTVNKNVSPNWPIGHSLPGAREARMWDIWRPYLSQQPLQGTGQPAPAQEALAKVSTAQSSKQPLGS